MIRKFSVDEVIRALLARRDETHASAIRARVETRQEVLGLTREARLDVLSELRPLLPAVREEFEWLNFLQDLWDGNYFEARLMALEMMYAKSELVDVHLFNMLDHWASALDNWVHADWLGHVRAIALARVPSQVVRLSHWLTSQEVYRRRSTLMSLAKIDPETLEPKLLLQPAELLAFIDPILDEKHPTVQAALAWLLDLVRQQAPEAWRSHDSGLQSRLAPETLRLLRRTELEALPKV